MFHDDFGIEESDEELPPVITRNSRNSIISAAEKCGWLQKRSKKYHNSWRYRYFALIDNKLYYYKTPSEKIPLGVYNFDQLCFDIQAFPKVNPKIITLIPINSPHRLYLKSSNLSDLQNWASALCSSILQSKGKEHELSSNRTKSKFWKHEIIFSKDMPSIAETGDLLIFKAQTPNSLKSTYTYVSFLIKYPNQGLGVLHANTTEGVEIIMWEKFIETCKFVRTSNIILRKLRVERTDEMLLKLEEFVKKVDKKKYRLSPVELLQRNNDHNISNDLQVYSAELVASALKYLGLMSSEVPVNSLSPKDFSMESNLSLMGARLSGNSSVEFDVD
ncbi:hypothetical protein SteCoe_32239 [Stentor coeruleus]|uniref:PH domain-containing protein n=1 Tax=Stentor coeruleus TaxID=5963 RepID=A0A1R2AZI3_9CILI|nr:hypothetical protein SteCoe_32239 [Stentor coeruleus]